MDVKRYREARAELIKVISAEPQNSHAFAMLAYCASKLGDKGEAIRLAREAIHLDPSSPYAHRILSIVSFTAQEMDTAEKAAREAIRLDPYNVNGFGVLARALCGRAKWQEALTIAAEGLKLDPIDIDCLATRAEAFSILGKTEEALAAARVLVQSHPEHPHSHTYAGWVVLRLGKPNVAAEHFRQALRLNPEFEWAREGMIEALRGRLWIYRVLIRGKTHALRTFRTLRYEIPVFLILLMIGLNWWDGGRMGIWFWSMPLVALYGVAIFCFTLSKSLLDLAMLTHPYGRIALTRDERAEAITLGALIGAVAVSGAIGWSMSNDTVKVAMVIGIAFLVATTVFSRAEQSPGKTKATVWVGYLGCAATAVLTLLGLAGWKG